MLALELDGDRLDQRIVREGVLDPPANRLDQVEELVGFPLGVAVEKDVREDLFIPLVEFVEEHIGEYTRMPATDRPPEVVVVGAASRDLAADDPRGWRLGGAVTYSAFTLARLGLRVGALVGVDREAARARELEWLRDAGVDLRAASLASGPVFDNVEQPAGRRQIAHAASGQLLPTTVPAGWLGSAAWILAPVAGELQGDWAAAPSQEAIVAVGWQGLLREVRAGEPVRGLTPRASPLLARADLVGVSRGDLPPDQALDDLCRFLRPGATLLVTAGEDGGIVAEVGPDGPRRLYRYPAVPADRSVDPTGAGDVFLAAVLAARARPGLVGGRIGQRHDLLLGAVVASLVVEASGLDGVPDRAAVRRRLARTMDARRGSGRMGTLHDGEESGGGTSVR